MSRDGSNPRAQGQHASKMPSAIVVRFLIKTPTVAQAFFLVRFWPSMSLAPITPNSGCTSTLQIMTPCNFLMPYTAKSGCPILPGNVPCKDNESPAPRPADGAGATCQGSIAPSPPQVYDVLSIRFAPSGVSG